MMALQQSSQATDLFWDCEPATATATAGPTPSTAEKGKERALSLFESIVTSYPPVLESLLAQLPTAALLELYHTSRHLRGFLQRYPLAWKTLSFRLPQPAVTVGSPGNETPDSRERQSKQYSFDALLKQTIAPNGTRITNLDLCNTAVNGIALVGSVLAPHLDTLQHLSVRGCKNVSIKYHIVPFLEPYTLKDAPWMRNQLALKSLYTYRCRHHRRRPYLPSSLIRRDSDSDPTHQLIEICHQLGIWTDTAWCPSPGGRCYRRKDYHAGRAAPQNMEVWVPFDRLWRSSNRIGPVEGTKRLGEHDGRLWEIAEEGQDGEPLGTENGPFAGEGKHVPAHARKSHTTFVDDIKCSQCDDVILERCESCSVRMHCMGCRKTLCASCAFNRPIPRKRVKTRHFANLAFGTGMGTLGQGSGSTTSLEDRKQEEKAEKNRFWWAPGATRSPNLMSESAHDDDSSDSEDTLNNGLPGPPAHRDPPKLNMHWCCLEPIFSGGGGIAVLGTGLGGRGADKIRAAPLPRTKQYEDPDFSNQLRPVDYIRELKNNGLYEYVLGEDVDILNYLKQDSLELQQQTCPRGLCNDCYRSFRWKVSCRACKNPICKEHDFGALKVRKCGYRDLHTERDHVRAHTEPPQRLVIPEFNPHRTGEDLERTPTVSSQLDAASAADNESESSEGTPMSQSQVLMAPGSTEMGTASSFNLTTTPNPFTITNSLSFVPVSSSRPRSLSASGVRSRNSVSWSNPPRGAAPTSISNPLPLPCHSRNHPVQWEGCGAYFCQYPRPVGDNRPQCPALLKECSECAVLVCDACAYLNPSCTCTFCTVNFHCPHCARKPHVRAKCRLDAELKAKKDAELRAKAKLERDRMERGQADELAGAMNEFFAALYTDNDVPADASGPYMTSSFADLPLSSPDSITVTTEFGVLEETGNVTIISAGGAAHPYDDEDELEYEEYAEDHDEDHYEGQAYHHGLAHEDQANYIIHTEDTAAPTPGVSTLGMTHLGASTIGLPTIALPNTDWVAAVAMQHQQEQNMWLLQQQMQNLYNVSLGNNTTPPPTQHVAPVVYHQEGELEGSEGDEGDEADVDTDEVLDEENGVDGVVTPTGGAGVD
ncbi:hypothetical protein N0V87_009646 [Didymella glomerata]|uniref:Uncharacterized protein n=1 Tax=Didymella glomerata TaxID=749621 RepID=A0A9W9BWR7_9PLEO|nr:hypothetical protein N0V87_009646 [Didymella glomerata]